jgi:hypothetical protein
MAWFVFCVLNCLMCEVAVRLVDIGRVIDQYCLNFLFIALLFDYIFRFACTGPS